MIVKNYIFLKIIEVVYICTIRRLTDSNKATAGKAAGHYRIEKFKRMHQKQN
jgi:hypothetical protein